MNTNKTWQTLVAVAVFMVVIVGFTPASAGAQSAEGDDRAAAIRILELVNRDRTQAGLPALAERADVTAVAAAWSASMANAQVLSHSDDYFSKESHNRLGAKSLGENVARNGSVDDAHARLMASPGHRANILSTGYTVIGIAVFRDARGTYWVTQDFLLPKTAAAPAPQPAPAPPRAAAPAPPPAPRPATPVAAPAPPVARTAAPATTVPQPEPARATVDTALIAAETRGGSNGWNGRPPAPVAAGGAPMWLTAHQLPVAAACANGLVGLALLAIALRRRAV